jgi:hypothetical protein
VIPDTQLDRRSQGYVIPDIEWIEGLRAVVIPEFEEADRAGAVGIPGLVETEVRWCYRSIVSGRRKRGGEVQTSKLVCCRVLILLNSGRERINRFGWLKRKLRCRSRGIRWGPPQKGFSGGG